MKIFVIFLTLMIFSTTNSYTKESFDCNDLSLKKNFSQKIICKMKKKFNEGNEKKTGKSLFSKDKTREKSFLKKFGEAKTLSDLN